MGTLCFGVHAFVVLALLGATDVLLRNGFIYTALPLFDAMFPLDVVGFNVAFFLLKIPIVVDYPGYELLFCAFFGGVQWWVFGFFYVIMMRGVRSLRMARTLFGFLLLAGINSGGAIAGGVGIERMRAGEFPPFLDGLYTIFTTFPWPPQWLVKVWSASGVGPMILWGHALFAPFALWKLHHRISNPPLLWSVVVAFSMVPAVVGMWIWFFARTNVW